jgi:hypothetical protein
MERSESRRERERERKQSYMTEKGKKTGGMGWIE